MTVVSLGISPEATRHLVQAQNDPGPNTTWATSAKSLASIIPSPLPLQGTYLASLPNIFFGQEPTRFTQALYGAQAPMTLFVNGDFKHPGTLNVDAFTATAADHDTETPDIHFNVDAQGHVYFQDVSVDGDIYAENGAKLLHDVEIKGALTSRGHTVFQHGVTICQDATIDGLLTTVDETMIEGNLMLRHHPITVPLERLHVEKDFTYTLSKESIPPDGEPKILRLEKSRLFGKLLIQLDPEREDAGDKDIPVLIDLRGTAMESGSSIEFAPPLVGIVQMYSNDSQPDHLIRGEIKTFKPPKKD